jgi:hypothetical protein
MNAKHPDIMALGTSVLISAYPLVPDSTQTPFPVSTYSAILTKSVEYQLQKYQQSKTATEV